MTFSGYADREATVGAKNGRRRLGPTHVPSSRVSIMYKADAFGPHAETVPTLLLQAPTKLSKTGQKTETLACIRRRSPDAGHAGGKDFPVPLPRVFGGARKTARDQSDPCSCRSAASFNRGQGRDPLPGHGIDREICRAYRFSCEGGRRQGTLPCSQPLLCIPSSFLWRRDFFMSRKGRASQTPLCRQCPASGVHARCRNPLRRPPGKPHGGRQKTGFPRQGLFNIQTRTCRKTSPAQKSFQTSASRQSPAGRGETRRGTLLASAEKKTP